MKDGFKYDVAACREQFPAMKLEVEGCQIAYLDGPGGTQVPQTVVDAMTNYLINTNANEWCNFKASRLQLIIEDNAREAVADLLGCEPDEIGFGSSSTQNNYNLAANLSKNFKPGDEIIVTEIDHRCNVTCWKNLERYGLVVKTVELNPETQQLDFEDYKAKLSDRTVLVAVNWGSNALGTITDVEKYIQLAHEKGAITVVDAVAYAPHQPIDVKKIDTDVLICSPYKWFGPHSGVIYMRKELMDKTDFNNVKTVDVMDGPRRFHCGTPQYEVLCGIIAAIDFIASEGEKYADFFEEELKGLEGRRRNIVAGILAMDIHELELAQKLRDGLRTIPKVHVYGPAEGQPRTPIVCFTMEGFTPGQVTTFLGDKGINAWAGDYYAVEVINRLGLRANGGMVRVGMSPYNTVHDIDRMLNTIRDVATM